MDFDEYDYLEKTAAAGSDDNPPNPDKPPTPTSRSDATDRPRSRSSRHRDADEPSRVSRSKRSRPEEERGDKARHREEERGDKARHREEERGDKDRHREEERGDKDRHREEERSSSRTDRDRHRGGRDSRDERNGKDRDRERQDRVREKEREREPRHGSRSRPERQAEEEAVRAVEVVPWEPREREHNSRRYKEKKDDAAEPEADPERDQRTVFAYQIALKADERDVYEFFSRAGKVRDVRLIMDRNSRRSKGVGYIEFYEALSVPMAIALSGQILFGQQVMVKPSEAEKNLVQSNTAAGGLTGPYSGGARRLYIGNLHFNINEEQLRLVLEPFGQVELIQLPRELETGHCKGYGFVQYARLEDARAALSLNGQLEIAGRVIKVSAVTDQVGMLDVGTNAGDFDDDEGGGLALNARSRAMLMQKLDRTGVATSMTGALVPPVASPLLQSTGLVPAGLPLVAPVTQQVESAGVPSECLLLKNMFDPNAETEPDFDLDIKDDVRDECSKFGTVLHIFVDKNSAGHVYLRFDSTSSSAGAQKALHGRWFAGKMILATYMLPRDYEAKFPNSNES